MPFIINNVVEAACQDSHIAPFWKMDSTERKLFESRQIPPYLFSDSDGFYVEERTFIYETTDKNMKFIQNAALYILALNTGFM